MKPNRRTRRARASMVVDGPPKSWEKFRQLQDGEVLQLQKRNCPDGGGPDRCLMNNIFLVMVFENYFAWGLNCDRVLVTRTDGSPHRSWHDFQRLKNELWSPEHVALEVYPSAKLEMESYGIYWLWVFPPEFQCPIEWRQP